MRAPQHQCLLPKVATGHLSLALSHVRIIFTPAPEHQPVPPQCLCLGSVLISKFSSQKHPNEEEMTSEALLSSAVLASVRTQCSRDCHRRSLISLGSSHPAGSSFIRERTGLSFIFFYIFLLYAVFQPLPSTQYLLLYS